MGTGMTGRAGVGHNRGPSLAGATGWRRHCWTEARAALLPTLPIEVVRLRVARAREIGLDYRTYAGIRATTGHDLVAFLFSTNALALLRQSDRLPPAQREKLTAVKGIATLVAAQPPLDPAAVARTLSDARIAPDACACAPTLTQGWTATRRTLAALIGARPSARVLVIGETALERDWVAAARCAAFLPAARFFPATA